MLTPQLNGSDVSAASLGPGCSLTGQPFFSATCNPFTTVTVGVAAPATGTFAARVAGTVSGQDSYSTNGRVELLNGTQIPVPEPATITLVGIAGLIGASRRRKR
jgi:hypothetical protein